MVTYGLLSQGNAEVGSEAMLRIIHKNLSLSLTSML